MISWPLFILIEAPVIVIVLLILLYVRKKRL